MKRRHEFSQHFLRSPKLVHELIGHTDIKRTDVVYDLGAGSGVISSVLAKRAGQVVAVEYEPQTVRKLRDNLRRYENVTAVEGDIMQLNFPTAAYKIFANIPFHISSPLVRRLTTLPSPPQSTYLIVQRQFARKLLPEHPGFSSQLGMMIAPWFSVRIRRPLRRTDFWPHPNVDTVLMELKPRSEPLLDLADRVAYERFVQRAFTDPAFFATLKTRATKASELTGKTWVALFDSQAQRPPVH